MDSSSEQGNQPAAERPSSDYLPSESQLADIYEREVLDKQGKRVKFSTLVNQSETSKTLVLFSSQAYLQALNNDLPPSRLAAHSATIKIIGCGEPELISKYASETQSPFPIYADPTRKLYDLFGLVVNLKVPEKSPDYITESYATMALDGMKQALLSGTKAFSGGKVSQNGGEILFVDGELKFIHRMMNTQDHLKIEDLEVLLVH